MLFTLSGKNRLKYQDQRKRIKFRLFSTCLTAALIFFVLLFLMLFQLNQGYLAVHNTHQRQLVAHPDVNFPDAFTTKQRKKGALVLHFLGMSYMFIAITLVCDRYFIPALTIIGKKLNFSEDVTGAVLVAAGGSMPELFTSLWGTLVYRTDVGFGTIIGSGAFNILCLIGICSLFAKEVLVLSKGPLLRDSFFYIITLVVLIIFLSCISPKRMEYWEAICLFLMYIIYLLILKFSPTCVTGEKNSK